MPSSADAWSLWTDRFSEFLDAQAADADAAHDRAHVERVVTTARQLADAEGAQMDVVVPAAWLHDCVVLPKDHPDRAQASQRAAEAARAFLEGEGYPEQWIPDIEHAIAAHSYSGDVVPETTEAKVVQDAELDHVYAKLLRLPDTMQTKAGRTAAQKRAGFVRSYLNQLASELDSV
ncbi:MAG: hydrolase [Bacteroidetes bacterium SW_7_64_58]|nr:MAG: hydrolase [Bacteroidetes bacterium SW_7_64_58]